MQTSQAKNSSSKQHKNSTAQSKLLEIGREFDVSVETLFKAFTTSDAIKEWWWPEGLHSDHVDLDFRHGGNYFINMKGLDAGGGGMTGQFENIEPNKQIVMTDSFADKNGNPISAQEAKMKGEWPKLVYITFDFYSLTKTRSRLTLSQQGIPNEMQKDCIDGWNQMFDKLERFIAGRPYSPN